MNRLERGLRGVDAFQQSHTWLAVPFAVNKKFGDDNAGNLVSVLAYTAFVTLFPLLLVLFTLLSLVLAHDPSLHRSIDNSVLRNFPVVGHQLQGNVHTLKRSSTLALVFGLLGLVWGSIGLAQAGIYAMSQIWNVPGPIRPNYWGRLLRSVEFLAVLGGGVVVSTGLAGFGTFGGNNPVLGAVGEVLAVAVNIGQYLLAFRILTAHSVGTRALVPGAVVAGVGWTVLQAVGGYVVGHDLKSSGAAYGTFGLVLGLLAWIYLAARLSIYAAEFNTVLEWKLWPRTMVQPPLSEADQRMLDLHQQSAVVRPEQEVVTTFSDQPMTQQEWLRRTDYQDGAEEGAQPAAQNGQPAEKVPGLATQVGGNRSANPSTEDVIR